MKRGKRKNRRATSCERFEETCSKQADQVTDSDFAFMAEHIDNCPLGIHTVEALDRVLRMTPEEVWSKAFLAKRKTHGKANKS